MKFVPLCLDYSQRNNRVADTTVQHKFSNKPTSTDDTNQNDSEESNQIQLHQSSRRLVCDSPDNAKIDDNLGDSSVHGSSGSVVSDLSDDDMNNSQQQLRLPRIDWFANNHVLVNSARQAHHVPVLHRNARLDWMAQRHAAHLAQCQRVQHSCDSVVALQEMLSQGTNGIAPMRVGENVFRGTSVRQIHSDTMERDNDQQQQQHATTRYGANARANLLSPAFHNFGMGTAMDRQGRLYMVQLFCSRATEREDRGTPTRSGEDGSHCCKAKSIGTGDFDPSWVWV